MEIVENGNCGKWKLWKMEIVENGNFGNTCYLLLVTRYMFFLTFYK